MDDCNDMNNFRLSNTVTRLVAPTSPYVPITTHVAYAADLFVHWTVYFSPTLDCICPQKKSVSRLPTAL